MPELLLLLMLLAFTRLLILSTSLDIDDVNVVQLLFQQEEEEEHKENDDEFFDDDETKNEELLLEIVLKGRDFKEEERAETPLNIYISFRVLFLCVRCSSISPSNKNSITTYLGFSKFARKKENFHFFEKLKTSQSWKKQTKKKNYHGGSITFINDKRFSANAGRATGSFGVSTGATNSR